MPGTKPNRVSYAGIAPYADQYPLKRCQSLTSSTDFTQERLLELANVGNTGVVDDRTVSATLEFNDYGETATLAAMIGQGQWDSSRTNDYNIHDNLFDNASPDITAKIASNSSTVERSMWLGNSYLTGISMSYTVDGVATESYDFEGDFKRWFMNAYANVTSYKADYSGTDTALISGTNLGASTGIGVLVTVNNKIVADTADGDTITTADVSSDTTITCSPALSLVEGDRIRLVASGTGTSFPALPTTAAGLGGLRRNMTDIYLWDTATGTEERILRAQSVDISVDLSREIRSELGTYKPYFRSLNRPIEVSVTLEFLDTDLEVYSKLAGGEVGWDADTLDSIDIEDFVKTNKLFIKMYNSESSHVLGNLLKTIEITSLAMSSEEESVSVGEDGTVSITLTADNLHVSGSGVNPIN